MNFVLDTNAVSELERPQPNSSFMDWHDLQDPAHLFITTISLAEVWHGFHALSPSHPDYERIKRFATDLPGRYRVLNFDTRAAAMWGELIAQTKGPLPLRDAFIGAIVRSRGYRIVTRDTTPFEQMGCKVVAPWN